MIRIVLLSLLLFPFLVSPLFGSDNENRNEISPDQNVIIISIDGFPADLLWDIKAHIPVIRTMALNGAWAYAMVPSNPTLTWANHTSIVTGVHPEKHCVIFNGKVEYTNGGLPVRMNSAKDKSELVNVPTVYDAAFEAGLTTAEINWPATRNAGTLHDSFPDVPDNVGNMTDELRWELYDLGILEDMTTFALWKHSSSGRDEVWLQSALHIIENRMPSLLLLHFLNVDSSHHRYGVGSDAGFTALQLIDYQINQILLKLENTGELENTNILITTDHGFTNTPNSILPNVALANHNLLNIVEGRIIDGRVQAISNGGISFIYLNDPDDTEALEIAENIFKNMEGVYKIIRQEEYHLYGLPDPSSCNQTGQLALASFPGYAFNNSIEGTDEIVRSADYGFSLGHHGFLNTFKQMDSAFIGFGPSIKKGVILDTMDIRSIAPTVAHILGINLDTAEGDVLYEILELGYSSN